MWGLKTSTQWLPWPAHGLPPQLSVLSHLPETASTVALLGGQGNANRDRWGFVGVPTHVDPITPGPGSIARAIDGDANDGLRVVVLGYELGRPLVYLPSVAPPQGQAAGLLLHFRQGLLVDHCQQTMAVYGPPGCHQEVLALANETPRLRPPGSVRFVPRVSDRLHQDRIRHALAAIACGEIYQANVTRRMRLQGRIDPVGTLQALHAINPVAHSAYIRTAGCELLSNSMETLLTYDPSHRLATSYPIKGTQARPRTTSNARKPDLAADPKERAEHIMIVDLVRNDLGRVCIPGSVHVPELMATYGYQGVWHGVSGVSGKLARDATPGQLMEVVFPGGSITGAPKRRAVELIADLEQKPRGFYTGTIGLIAPNGHMSASILIRTLVRDATGWNVGVGGGIVADSHPQRETDETWSKIGVFRRVLERQAGQARPSTGSRRGSRARCSSSVAGSTNS